MSKQADRSHLTASRSGHCRMELWLDAHGHEPEPFQPGAERTMDYGTLLEYLLFDGVEVIDHHSEGGKKTIGKWWEQEIDIVDPITKMRLVPAKMPIRDPQRLVEHEGFFGRIDRLADAQTQDLLQPGDQESFIIPAGAKTTILLDSKSTNQFSYDRAMKNPDLMEDTFLREYVLQQQFLMAGLRNAGENVMLAALVFINKVQSKIACRFIPWNAVLARQAVDRLTAGLQDAEPEPEYPWTEDVPIPLRCSYCSQRTNCATTRNLKLEMGFTKRGGPEWRPKRLL